MALTPARIGDGLNPRRISQTARLISHAVTGIAAIPPHTDTC